MPVYAITVKDAWAPPSFSQNNGVVYMTLANDTRHAIKWIAAEAHTTSRVVELHTHVHEAGVLRMRQVPHITVPARGKVVLQPGGLHVMLIGLKQPLVDGGTIAMRLTFKDAPPVKISVPISKARLLAHLKSRND